MLLFTTRRCTDGLAQNGGHCQPGVWNNNPNIARFELATFNLIRDLVAENDIHCDWEVVGGVHAFFSQEIPRCGREAD